MNLVTLSLVAIISIAVYFYFKKQLSYFKERGIPYVPGWPLLGNMAEVILRRKHISETILDMYNYNPEAKYVGAFDFTSPIIVLRDPDLIKNTSITNFDSFRDHEPLIDENVDPLFGKILFNVSGDRWKEARTLLNSSFSISKLKAMHELIVKCSKDLVNHLLELSPESRKNIATKNLYSKYSNDVIAICIFGVDINSHKDPENDFFVLGKNASDLDGPLAMKFFMSRAFPRIVKLFGIKFVDNRTNNFFKNIIQEIMQINDEKGIGRPDVIRIMMNARGKGYKNLKLDVQEITSHAFSFFFAGFETVSSQLCAITHELAANPKIQTRLQKEIDDVMEKSNGNPTFEDIHDMTYLDCVFNEIYRMHTIASFLDRKCTKRFEFPPAVPGGKPFIMEPGTSIWIPVYAIHNNPEYYDNPREFNPDRYDKKRVTTNDVMNYAFGIGPRGCPGKRLSNLEMKILLVYMLQKFNFKPNPRTHSPLKYSKSSFSINAEGGYWITIEPRN